MTDEAHSANAHPNPSDVIRCVICKHEVEHTSAGACFPCIKGHRDAEVYGRRDGKDLTRPVGLGDVLSDALAKWGPKIATPQDGVGFDLWRAIDAAGGYAATDWDAGFNHGLTVASEHVERLGYFESDIVLPKATVDDMIEALRRIAEPLDCGCVPCMGQCRSQTALEIEIEERQVIARGILAQIGPCNDT